jgi:CPA2 family monovalent cation:H+ antiporter-2
MVVGAAMTFFCHRYKQPVVIGYLLAGFIVGPNTPPFSMVYDLTSIRTMAELGLIFLMFALGLEFSLPKLRKVGLAAVLGASFEVLGMLALGYLLGRLFGWSQGNSIFLGAILSMSSTTIIVKVFMDLKMMKEEFTKIVFAILILEDIVAIVILSVISGLGASHGSAASIVASSMTKVVFFIVLFLVFGLLLVPRLLRVIAGFHVKEVLGVTALGLCLAGSFLAAKFGLSVALGAFLMGAVIAASDEAKAIEEWVHPIRDMFSAIFFISAGMMIQPQVLWDYKWQIIVIATATLLGKIITDTAGSFLAGQTIKDSFKVGVSLGQIGEFSFVIASLGATLKMTSDFFFPLAVAVSSLTTFCTPYLIRNSDGIVEFFMRLVPRKVQTTLDRYHLWFRHEKHPGENSMKTAVFSKYLIRLVVYVNIVIAFLLLIQIVSRFLTASADNQQYLFLLWLLCALISLPLFVVIAKYSNHILLLWVTTIPAILQVINVRYFYNTARTTFFGLTIFAYAFMANKHLESWAYAWALAGIVVACGLLGRKKLALGAEWLEKVLDEILGLATSEPNRQALVSAERTAFLSNVMEPVSLAENSAAIGETIRSLHLRENTGVSVVAVYREGKHVSNPSPDMELLANDILIVIGDPAQRERAKEILSA